MLQLQYKISRYILIFVLTSDNTNQTGFLAVCDRQDPIADIVYEYYGGATNVVFSWTIQPKRGEDNFSRN